jgi:hypothetical protein
MLRKEVKRSRRTKKLGTRSKNSFSSFPPEPDRKFMKDAKIFW